DVSYAPLFDDRYLLRLYDGKPTAWQVAVAFFRRLSSIFRASRFQLVVIEKELMPWAPWFIERGLIPSGVKLVIDIDDAIFHRYEDSRSPLVRGILGGKFSSLFRRADLVTAGNEFLASVARQSGCSQVEVVPTVVDSGKYFVQPR